MNRHKEIIKRLLDLAEKDENIHAVVMIGSSTREYSKADEYSDIDIIIATKSPDEWLYGNNPEKLGEVKISFIEPTLGGGKERRILYNSSLDVDIIAFTPEQFKDAIINGVANEVMNRGYSVLYDSMGISELLKDHIQFKVTHKIISEEEFINIVNDFFFHVVWASKKILRGELWTAKMCIDSYLKNYLLKIIETYTLSESKKDVWHCGRFLEKWADKDIVDELKTCFAHYDRSDMILSLISTTKLFSKLAKNSAINCNYKYPEKADKYANELLREYFSEYFKG